MSAARLMVRAEVRPHKGQTERYRAIISIDGSATDPLGDFKPLEGRMSGFESEADAVAAMLGAARGALDDIAKQYGLA